MTYLDFPQHVLNRAEAAAEIAYETGGEVADEMAYHAVLESWIKAGEPQREYWPLTDRT